jgi:pyrroline-5-carboxylate reductase
MPTRLITIGGGTMAKAILFGAVRQGLYTTTDLLVVEPSADARGVFESQKVRAVGGLDEVGPLLASEPAPVVLLAVKPQSLEAVSKQWVGAGLRFGGVVISILAGTPSYKVRDALGGSARVVRAMPNTPARIGQGATAVSLGEGARADDAELAVKLFVALGPVVEVVPESHMDAVTALSGSGPAYLFYLAEAMLAAATDAGLDPRAADALTRQTLLGAAALLSQSPEEAPEALRAAVTSKGGTTEAACRVLDDRRVKEALRDAVLRARDRGRELAG